MFDSHQKLCLTDLLDQDLSSYEFFYSQPAEVQKEIQKADTGSFSEMQAIASRCLRDGPVLF